MSKMLSLVLAAGLLALPPATYAVDYGSQPAPQTQQGPPVAQPLVREGYFAIKLATEFKLGSPLDERAAEGLLAGAGISPADGWISDYPVTPEIIGQLDDALKRSAKDDTLPVSYDAAKQDLTDIAQELALPVPAQDGMQPAEAPQPNNASDYSDYYDTEGPPVVTYYPPPAAYAYLYDWVPYPAIWFGISFPGFFICHQFTRVVTVGPAFGFRHPHRAIVTNRFVDPGTRRSFFVLHGFRGSGQIIRPHTMLRPDDRRRAFDNFREFHGAGGGPHTMTRPRPVMPHVQSPMQAPHPRSFGTQQSLPGGARRPSRPPAMTRTRPVMPHIQSPTAPNPGSNGAVLPIRPPSSATTRQIAPPTSAPGSMQSWGGGRAAGGGRMGGGGGRSGGYHR